MGFERIWVLAGQKQPQNPTPSPCEGFGGIREWCLISQNCSEHRRTGLAVLVAPMPRVFPFKHSQPASICFPFPEPLQLWDQSTTSWLTWKPFPKLGNGGQSGLSMNSLEKQRPWEFGKGSRAGSSAPGIQLQPKTSMDGALPPWHRALDPSVMPFGEFHGGNVQDSPLEVAGIPPSPSQIPSCTRWLELFSRGGSGSWHHLPGFIWGLIHSWNAKES